MKSSVHGSHKHEIVAAAHGHAGALTLMGKVLRERPPAVWPHFSCSLDVAALSGAELWDLYDTECGRDFDAFVEDIMLRR